MAKGGLSVEERRKITKGAGPPPDIIKPEQPSPLREPFPAILRFKI